MKKIIVLLILLFCVIGFCFGANAKWRDLQIIVKNFFDHGNYILVTDNSENSTFWNRNAIIRIDIDPDTLSFEYTEGEDEETETFYLNKYNISNDANNNIIVIRK